MANDPLTENSLKSLEKTIKLGYTHIEVDLRCLKDGNIVCMHDSTLNRMIGMNKAVEDMTTHQLNEITLSANSFLIPSFDVFCDKCKGRINLMPDIKRCKETGIKNYTTTIKNILEEYDFSDNSLIIGDEDILENFQGIGRIAYHDTLKKLKIKAKSSRNLKQYYFIFNHGNYFNKRNVKDYQQFGLIVIASINSWHYPNNDPDMQHGINDIRKMLKIGVDGLQIDSRYDDFTFSQISSSCE